MTETWSLVLMTERRRELTFPDEVFRTLCALSMFNTQSQLVQLPNFTLNTDVPGGSRDFSDTLPQTGHFRQNNNFSLSVNPKLVSALEL